MLRRRVTRPLDIDSTFRRGYETTMATQTDTLHGEYKQLERTAADENIGGKATRYMLQKTPQLPRTKLLTLLTLLTLKASKPGLAKVEKTTQR